MPTTFSTDENRPIHSLRICSSDPDWIGPDKCRSRQRHLDDCEIAESLKEPHSLGECIGLLQQVSGLGAHRSHRRLHPGNNKRVAKGVASDLFEARETTLPAFAHINLLFLRCPKKRLRAHGELKQQQCQCPVHPTHRFFLGCCNAAMKPRIAGLSLQRFPLLTLSLLHNHGRLYSSLLPRRSVVGSLV